MGKGGVEEIKFAVKQYGSSDNIQKSGGQTLHFLKEGKQADRLATLFLTMLSEKLSNNVTS